ncbi:hypothetical protein BDC45DRAFT_358386 [Circinella umbellata]|nr:hypothetical protein BDC45DRAFT_358386 [Circinella umbellata]
MRMIVGVKPDLIISKNMLEYGAAEHGYEDEAGVGTKELTERYLKLPKTLKDMMLKIGQYLDNDRKALHTHLRMVGLIMDAPCGYVCRIRELKEYINGGKGINNKFRFANVILNGYH